MIVSQHFSVGCQFCGQRLNSLIINKENHLGYCCFSDLVSPHSSRCGYIWHKENNDELGEYKLLSEVHCANQKYNSLDHI